MSEVIKDDENENNEEAYNLDSPNKQNTYIPKRKRKELINSDSENDEIQKSNDNDLQVSNKEETNNKEENNKYGNNDMKLKCDDDNNNKDALDKNNRVTSPVKNNVMLQEKLKKIFMNRDKLKFQYTKQEIPESLKYNSDDSDSSDFSQLKKNKNNKNKEIIDEKNKIELNNEYEKENEKNSLNIKNNINKNTLKSEEVTIHNKIEDNNIEKKEENIKYLNQKEKNEERRKTNSKININIKNVEKDKKFEENNDDINNKNLENNKEDLKKENLEIKEDKEDKDINKTDKSKKNDLKQNIILKTYEKKDKKDIEITNNSKINNNIDEIEIEIEKEKEKGKDNKTNIKEKKQKLLKLLIEKRNNEEKEKDLNEYINEDKNKKGTLKLNNKNNEEKDNIKIGNLNKIKSESNSPKNLSTNKVFIRFDRRENSSRNKKEEKNIPNKGSAEKEKQKQKREFSSKNSKNKFSVGKKIKKNSSKKYTYNIGDNNEKKNNNDKLNQNENNEKDILKQNKKNSPLLDIIEKLKQKKSDESKLKNSPKKGFLKQNNNNEKKNESFEKNEKKIKGKKLVKQNIENKIKNNKDNKEENMNKVNYENKNNIINSFNKSKGKINNNKKVYDLKKYEKKNKLEENLKDEMIKDINEINKKDEISTVNNSSLINNSQLTQIENDEKINHKEYSSKAIPRGNKSNTGSTYKNNATDENNYPSEIVLNEIPSSNLEKSFDTINAYMKRKIPIGKSSMNIYKPKKVNNIRNVSQERNLNELIKNNSNSYNPNKNNQNIVYNNSNFIRNSPCYIRNKSKFNSKTRFTKNNSFCEFPLESNPNSIRENNNINIEIDLGGGLNSSFDTRINKNYINLNQNNNSFNGIEPIYGNPSKKYNNLGYNKKTNIPFRNNNYSKNSNINGFYKNENVNKSYGLINSGFNNNNFYDINNLNRNINNKIDNYFIETKSPKFITYNNYSENQIINYNQHNKSPLKTYENQLTSNSSNENNENYYYQNSQNIPKRYSSTKNSINMINNQNNNYSIYNNINNNIYDNNPTQIQNEKNISINIEDLLVLEEKFIDIILALGKNLSMHNECFEFWNYYYNCSLYGQLEKSFKPQDILNVQISINYILMSVMICYDYSFQLDILNGEYSILEDILRYNHKNLIIIYENILSKISTESQSNPWVFKLRDLINSYTEIKKGDEYLQTQKRVNSPIDKICFNISIIVQNIRVLLKNYKTKRIELLTSFFKKINDKSYEEINSYFRDNILRVDNVNGSILASVFLKENEYFKTEPAPYIKTKNRKPFSLILDLDETLIHFKMNTEEENEGILQIRPGVIPFLEKVGKFYELIVFTAATQDYGDLLIDAIEENNLYFEHRFYRQHTVIIGNDFVKDLNRIGRPIDKMIIVDNMPQNFRLQKENGINIKAFWGEDANDNALEELGTILINIAKEGGDLRIGLEKYKDEIVRKVTSNISKNNY